MPSAEGPEQHDPTPMTLQALRAVVGQEIATSPWLRIDQTLIDRFADATGDHQWIHVDPERAASSEFGSTIAHGFLVLASLAALREAAVVIRDAGISINYGLDRVRFTAPVPVGSRIRARFAVGEATERADGLRVVWRATVERDAGGEHVVVCVADLVVLYRSPQNG